MISARAEFSRMRIEDVTRILQKIPDAVRTAGMDGATTVRNLVVGRTPVATGVAKRSWSSLQTMTGGFSFASNLDYMEILEEGLYARVGPRTVQTPEGIFSRQAPGGMISPVIEDEEIMVKVLEGVVSQIVAVMEGR